MKLALTSFEKALASLNEALIEYDRAPNTFIRGGKVVAAIPISLPPDPLLSAFSDQTRPLLAKIAQNNAESRTLAALRDLLLPGLMSGEVRVREAEKHVREAT